MIKTLKTSISRALSNTDKHKLTIFKIRFLKELFKGEHYEVQLNFSKDSIIYWGDGTMTTQPDKSNGHSFTHSHVYTKEVAGDEQTITIICEGYPQPNCFGINNTESPFDSNVLCGIDCLSVDTESAARLFANCKQLTSISEHLFAGTKITNFNYCFARSGLNYIPEKLFDPAEKFATFNRAFYFCEDLTESDLVFGGPNSLTFNQFTQIFMSCKELKSVNKDMFKNVKNISTLSGAFLCCYKIIILPGFFDTLTHTNFNNCFCTCHLTADDFLGVEKRIPLDLFANSVIQSGYDPNDLVRNIFYSAVSSKNAEEFKKAGDMYPDSFKMQYGPAKVQLDKLDIYSEG